MAIQVIISGTTGTPPYEIQVCDIINTYCYPVTSGVVIPPSYTFFVPPPLDVTESFLLKIKDSNGCERLELLSCPIINKMFEDGIFFLFEDGVEYIFEG